MLLTNWLTLFQARLNRAGHKRRRPRVGLRRARSLPIVVSAEVFEARQMLSSTSLAPSIGGNGFVASPESTFNIPLTGNSSQHIDQTTAFTPGIALSTGNQTAGGTQHQVLDIVATVTSNGTQTYSEIDTVTYDVTSGDSANGAHEYGNFTYSLFASAGAGITSWNLIYSTSDTDVDWTTTVSNGDTSGSTIEVSATATTTTTGMMNNWMNYNNDSATGFSTQTTIASSNQTMGGTYWHSIPGGQINGTASGSGSSFDLSTFTESLIQAPGGLWTGSGTAMASGSGGNNSSYSGSGTYFTDPIAGTMQESGSTDDSYHYNGTGILNSDMAWSATGGGTDSGSSSGSTSYSGTGDSNTSGSSTDSTGAVNSWSTTTNVSQSGSNSSSSNDTIDLSLTNDGWVVADGSGSSSGSGSDSSANSSSGTFSVIGTNVNINGTTSGGGQNSSSNSYSTTSTMGSDGNWITTGSTSGSASGSSSGSSSGSGSSTNSGGPNGATGTTTGNTLVANSQSTSFNQTSGYTLGADGSWGLTSGSGSASGSSSSFDSFSGSGGYASASTIGIATTSRSGTQSQGSMNKSQSSYSTSALVIGGTWVTVSGSGSGSGESSSSASFSGTGSYTAAAGSDSITGTSTESGSNSSDSTWNSNSIWATGPQAGWVTTASGSDSASGSSDSTYTGSGSYSNSGSGQLSGAANVSGTNYQGGETSSAFQSNDTTYMDSTGTWYLVGGSGSSSNSTSSSFSSMGSGSYNRNQTTDPSLASWIVSGTVNESSFLSSSGSSSTTVSVVNGQWQTMSGTGAGAGSQSDSSSWSGSGNGSLPVTGGRLTGTVSDQAGNSDSSSYTTQATLGSDDNWTTTGSGSGSSSGTTNFTFNLASGSYSRDLSGGVVGGLVAALTGGSAVAGEVDGTVTGYSTDVTSDNSNYNVVLDSSGNWDLTSGNGSSTEQSGFGQSYSGSGSYSSDGLDLGTGTSWSYGGTIIESGTQYATDGNFQNASVVNGQWQNGTSGDATTIGASSNFSDSGNGEYNQPGGISGLDQQNNSNSTAFSVTFTTDTNGNVTTSGSGSSIGNGGYSFSGGAELTMAGVTGQYTESGSGSTSSSSTVQYGPGTDSSGNPWVITSGTMTVASAGGSTMTFSGSSTTDTFSNSNGLTSTATNESAATMSGNNSASETDGSIWSTSLGAWVQTSGSQSNSNSEVDTAFYSNSGTYAQALGDGTINGTFSASGSGSISASFGYSGSFADGAWNLSGSGTVMGSGSSSSSYSGTGSYNGGGITGSMWQSGSSSYSSKGEVDSTYDNNSGGFVLTGGTSSENGGDGSNYGFSGGSTFSLSANGGTATGSASESGSATSSDSYNDKSTLDPNGNSTLVSGTSIGTAGASYSFSSSGSGSFTSSFDTNGVVSGTTSQSSMNDWSENETDTGSVVNGAWVDSDSGSGSGSGSSSFSYFGSGNSSSDTVTSSGFSDFSSQLTVSGSSSNSSSGTWDWGDDATDSWFDGTSTQVTSSSSMLIYSSSGSSSSTIISGDYAGGNGSESIGSSANSSLLTESFSSSATTLITDSQLDGVDTETTDSSGSGSGTGTAAASSTSSSYSDTKSTSPTSSSDSWSSSSMYLQEQDTFNESSSWESAMTTVNGTVTGSSSSGSSSGSSSSSGSGTGSSSGSPSGDDNVAGSMTTGGTFASGWTTTFTAPGSGSGSGSGGGSGTGSSSGSGSGSGSGTGSGGGSGTGTSSGSTSGSSYTSSSSTSSSWGPITQSYQQLIQGLGFSPQAYTGAGSRSLFTGVSVGGGPAGNASMPDFAAASPPAIPGMSTGSLALTSLSNPPVAFAALAATPVNSGPSGMPGADLSSTFIPSPDQVDPNGYSNPLTRFLGENIIRPVLGDAYLISTTNEQMLSDGLDNLGTFVVAMGDTISFGGTKWIRQNLYSIDTVNYNSGAYTAGEVAGAAVMTVISIAGSGGTCILGGVGPGFSSIARVYASAGTWIGAGQAASNVISTGRITFSDALALAPALGKGIQKIANFGCFVIDTPVAVGWNSEPIYVGQVSQPASPDSEDTISVAWLLTGLGLVVTAVYVRDRRKEDEEAPRKHARSRRLVFAHGKFHEEPEEPDDDHGLLPPFVRGGQGGAGNPQISRTIQAPHDLLLTSREGQSSRHAPRAESTAAHNPFAGGIALRDNSQAVAARLSAVLWNTVHPHHGDMPAPLSPPAGEGPEVRGPLQPIDSGDPPPPLTLPANDRPFRSLLIPLASQSPLGQNEFQELGPMPLTIASAHKPASEPHRGLRRSFRTPNSALRTSSLLRTLCWSLPFLLAGLCFWQALPGARSASQPVATASVLPAAPATTSATKRTLITRPVQDIRPGMRVLAENPELKGQDIPQLEIDPETTRLVSLHMVKPDGHELTIETLLPLESLFIAAIDRLESSGTEFARIQPEGIRSLEGAPSLDAPDFQTLARSATATEEDMLLNEILIGHEIELHLAELGAEGPASITSIQPCPPIESDDHTGRRLVTSVFRHEAANVIDVAIGNLDQSIGVTANHPFWSEDRQSFVSAGNLRPGENLRKVDGTLIQVTRITPRRGPPVPVFNFEVDGQHVYSVGSDGLLVHNDCSAAQLAANAKAGAAAEQFLASALSKFGFKVVGRNVLVQTSAGRREIDIVIELGGKLFGIEVKTGNAVRNASQIAKDKLINGSFNQTAFFGKKAKTQGLIGILESIWEARVP
jgi:hypothetical protein